MLKNSQLHLKTRIINLGAVMDLEQLHQDKNRCKNLRIHVQTRKKKKEKLIHAFIFGSSLDYCNGLFTGLYKNALDS